MRWARRERLDKRFRWRKTFPHVYRYRLAPRPLWPARFSFPTDPSRLTPETFAQTKALVDAAIALRRDELQHLTAPAVAERAGVDEAVLHEQFTTPRELLPVFYDVAVQQYHFLRDATEGYDSFSLEEKLASFYFILLDALGEQRAFVQDTFDTSLRRSSSFRAGVRGVLRDLLTSGDVPGTTQLVTGLWPVHEVLTEITFAVIRHWINDATEQQQATTALVDKLVAFVAELVTFRGVQRGADLAWYAYQSDVLGLGRLPLVGWLFRR